ncbi:MAG TPA: hypothetical protein VNN09_03920 [Candidatus Competibacteraceae bacterium]|nr:hypothetical protein [Candidatus Competibacteraceae bacterium]
MCRLCASGARNIPLLVQRFIDKYSVRHDKKVAGVTEAALRALQTYAWSGNIRELENIIERGVILTPRLGHIDLPDLFSHVTISPEPPAAVAPASLEAVADTLLDLAAPS